MLPLLLAPSLLVCLSAAPPLAADRLPFADGFTDISAWQASSETSGIAKVAAPGGGGAALEWRVPPVEQRVYTVSRVLPISVDPSYVIRLSVTTSEPTAVEVQLATEGQKRLYSILRLAEAGTHGAEVKVSAMSPAADIRAAVQFPIGMSCDI